MIAKFPDHIIWVSFTIYHLQAPSFIATASGAAMKTYIMMRRRAQPAHWISRAFATRSFAFMIHNIPFFLNLKQRRSLSKVAIYAIVVFLKK